MHPADLVLLPLGVRRLRCEFCHAPQRHWLLPRPVRWVFAALFVVASYVASVGPVDWLHQQGRMSDLTYERVNTFVYAPLNNRLSRSNCADCRVAAAFWKYRSWWTGHAASDVQSSATFNVAVPLLDISDLD